jgi:hypothetical protein
MVEKTFKEPATIGSWVIVNFTQRSNSTKLNQFMRNLYQAMDRLGSLSIHFHDIQFISPTGMGNSSSILSHSQ